MRVALTEATDAPELVAVALALHAAGVSGGDVTSIGATANVSEDAAEARLAELAEDGRALRLQKPPSFVDASLAREVLARLLERLEVSETASPWMVGATSLALARALDVPELTLTRLVDVFIDDGRLVRRAGYYATPNFTPQLTNEQLAFFGRLFASDPARAPVPLSALDVTAAIRAAKIVGLAQAFETLQASGTLVKVGDAVYRGTQIAEIRAKLEATLRRDKQITMAEFRDLVGTSRKFAVPLLEWFDATGVTVRSGDVRLLRIVPQREAAVVHARANERSMRR